MWLNKMSMATWLIIFLYSFSISLTASTDVFKKAGSFVQLDIENKTHSYDEIEWLFNTSTVIVKYISPNIIRENPNYKDRMEFNSTTYSLTLKNLQKSNSGQYHVEGEAALTKHRPASYSLYVLDPVEKPKLHVDYQQGNCNVTCSDNKFSITTSYYNKTFHERNETSNEVSHHSLLLYVSGYFIVCNASNRVSSEETRQSITVVKKLCSPEDSPTSAQQSFNIPTWIYGVLAAFGLAGVFFFIRKYRTKTREHQIEQPPNTVYEEVKDNKQPRPVEMSKRSDLPHTVYSTVSAVPNTQAARTPMSPADSNIYDKTPDEGLNYNAVECTKPQTIYAMVNKNGKPTLED